MLFGIPQKPINRSLKNQFGQAHHCQKQNPRQKEKIHLSTLRKIIFQRTRHTIINTNTHDRQEDTSLIETLLLKVEGRRNSNLRDGGGNNYISHHTKKGYKIKAKNASRNPHPTLRSIEKNVSCLALRRKEGNLIHGVNYQNHIQITCVILCWY